MNASWGLPLVIKSFASGPRFNEITAAEAAGSPTDDASLPDHNATGFFALHHGGCTGITSAGIRVIRRKIPWATTPSSSDLVAIKQALPCFYSSDRGTFAEEYGRTPIEFFCSSVALDVKISVFPADGLSDHSIVVATIDGIGSGS
jgi:hypothetical protein